MKRFIALAAAIVLAATIASVAAFGHESRPSARAARVTVVKDIWFELVGQFENSGPGVTPVTHIHYGYISWIQGVSPFGAASQTLKTAKFTFFADGKTSPVVTNGPLVFNTRTGTLTIYRDPSTNGNFAHPNTFRDGTPVLIARYRHQPIQSTLTHAITLLSHDRITFTRPFPTDHGEVQLGRVGDTFEEHYVGQGNMPGPPSGYFIGNAVSR